MADNNSSRPGVPFCSFEASARLSQWTGAAAVQRLSARLGDMTAEQAEVWHKVADIVESRPKEFDMEYWERKAGFFRCRTAACVAGHVGIMHGDPFSSRKVKGTWNNRQAERLGIDPAAGTLLFCGRDTRNADRDTWLRLIRSAAEHVRDSESLLTRSEMLRIVQESLVP